MDRVLRHGAPLILLGLAALVFVEPWLPGRERIAELVGRDGLLRFATGCLAVYTAVLVLERRQLALRFQAVLGELRRFRGGSDPTAGGSDTAGARREALRILAAAMRSADADVRRSARENLARLLGRDLGDDADAWQAAVDREAGPA